MSEINQANAIKLATKIVCAYVSKNSVRSSDLPALINDVHAAFFGVDPVTVPSIDDASKPAVSIRKSVTDAFIICLEDGLKFKSLRRHLNIQYNLTPNEYREKWNLPSDYPMVAPNYAKARSELAKQMELGKHHRRKI